MKKEMQNIKEKKRKEKIMRETLSQPHGPNSPVSAQLTSG
jgi:hypothetical protein